LPATVYCSYHYGVDVIGGVAVALGALAIARNRKNPVGRRGRRDLPVGQPDR
jgi:membrane-associated phospholipid phosphatase